MKVNPKLVVLAVGVIFVSGSYVRAEEGEEKAKDADISRINDTEEEQGKFFFGSYYTTTFTALSTLTSVKPYFCILQSNNQVCTGRKLRRKRKVTLDDDISYAEEVGLDDSAGEASKGIPISNVGFSDKEKFLFTVWRSTTTTTTVTSFSTDTSVTISVSARCTHSNFGTIPLCG